ncbi:HTTM domain-containing protein [Streptomyces sp. NPDC058989]|uniref:HTTM domain-containing protein n=1 Tax=Streptomyces sp. NPDC058989 TaxID=3346686 RepID=UPI0036A06771
MFSSPAIGRHRALAATERITAVTSLLSSLEALPAERDRRPGGLNNWEVVRDNFADLPPVARKALDLLAKPTSMRIIHGARIAAAATLLLPGERRRQRAAANGFLALSTLATYPHHQYGGDGSDQLSFQTQLVSAVARCGQRNPAVVDACLWYVALQSTLSYTVSGLVKLCGPEWRAGTALSHILRTETYGDAGAYRLISRYPTAGKAVSHAVLAFECAFGLIFLRQGRHAPAMLATTATFHLVNARVMGLSRFVWAFLGTYPAVLYVVQGARPAAPTVSLPARAPAVAATAAGAGR